MACEDDVLELMDQLAEKDRENAELRGRLERLHEMFLRSVEGDQVCLELFEANEAMGERITELNTRLNDKNWLIARLVYLRLGPNS